MILNRDLVDRLPVMQFMNIDTYLRVVQRLSYGTFLPGKTIACIPTSTYVLPNTLECSTTRLITLFESALQRYRSCSYCDIYIDICIHGHALSCSHPNECRAGDFIVRQGDVGDHLYFIKSGKVRAYTKAHVHIHNNILYALAYNST